MDAFIHFQILVDCLLAMFFFVIESWRTGAIKCFFIKFPIKIKNKKWKFPNGTLFIFNILCMIISISLLFCCWWDRSFPYRLLDANQSNLSNIYLKHWTLIQNDNLKNNSNKPYIIIEFQIIKDCVYKKKKQFHMNNEQIHLTIDFDFSFSIMIVWRT